MPANLTTITSGKFTKKKPAGKRRPFPMTRRLLSPNVFQEASWVFTPKRKGTYFPREKLCGLSRFAFSDWFIGGIYD
jgi:hypothetical protein